MSHPHGRRLGARRLVTLLLLLAAAGCLLSPSAPGWLRPSARAAGSVFVVNSTGDTPDANTSDGVCDDGAGRCTLRAAIRQANATAGADTINFQIGTGVQTIVLGSTLPDVSDPVVIDGSTQPGYSGTPLVEILGQENVLPAVSWVLRITAGSSTVRALATGRASVGLIVLGIGFGNEGSNGLGGNRIESCYIGLRADGVTRAGAGGGCVTILDSPNNTVGGPTAGARNVISGCGTGVEVAGSGAKNNVVAGNYIGTNAAGTQAVANQVGVTLRWVASNNAVGGNVISGNGRGVWLQSDTSVVQGNLIGTDASGASPLPNADHGVFISSDARNNLIGGTLAGAANRIAFNGGAGIAVAADGFSIGHTLSGNSIFSNGRLGIDLIAPDDNPNTSPLDPDGVTLNDAGDADAGPNTLQNAPAVLSVSSSASPAGDTTSVQGRLDSAPNQTYVVEVFAGTSCDPSGHGEGQTYLGSTAVVTDAAGGSTFAVSFPTFASGQVFTATARDTSGNTSEFSACYEANAPGTVQFTAASFEVNEPQGTGTVAVTRTLGTAGAASVDYATNGGTAAAGSDYTPTSGTLNFAPGEATKTFTINILNDALDEDAETVLLTLSNPTGGIVVGAGGTSAVNIGDDDAPPRLRLIAPNAGVVAEGNFGTTPAVFRATLSAPSGKVVSVNYATADVYSFAPQDYQPASGTLVFNPGEVSKEVTVGINGDLEVEADEAFEVRLSDPVNATLVGFGARVTVWDDDSPGVHFSAPTYTVNEADRTAVITVVRRGNASAAESVAYKAYDVSLFFGAVGASQRNDFTPALGTFDFAPGETEKSFVVLVTDDAYVEEPELVMLEIDFPPGVEPHVLSARLIINSDDTQPPTAANNPVDDTTFFVRRHYHDFLSREPDPEGLAFWVADIERCGADAQCREVQRINVSGAFFLSIEFQQTGYQVFRINRASFPEFNRFGRGLPEFLGFLRDTQRVGRGVVVGQPGWEERLRLNREEFAREWVTVGEFASLSKGLTGEQFVDKLFANSGVTPTTQERAAALAAFGAGGAEGRAAALLSVTDSGSVFNRQYNPAFVYMQYVGYLRRAPYEEPDNTNLVGFDFWLGKLDSFTEPGEDARDEGVAIRRVRRAEMVKAFLSSTEYRARFGTP